MLSFQTCFDLFCFFFPKALRKAKGFSGKIVASCVAQDTGENMHSKTDKSILPRSKCIAQDAGEDMHSKMGKSILHRSKIEAQDIGEYIYAEDVCIAR